MAIKIPNKAFLSFTMNQCLNTLWRMGKQISDLWEKEVQRQDALTTMQGNLETLKGHENKSISSLAVELLGMFPTSVNELDLYLMKLERLLEKDLKDSDFLISTIDEFEKSEVKIHPIHIVCDNLRSSFNVGSLFRTAEALGVEKIHLCGYTPTPENSKTAKSALGTDQWVQWESWESTLDCLDTLKNKGMNIYAFETEESAVALNKLEVKYPAVIVLGNERFGLADPVLNRADQLVSIPLSGKKNSLNVASCAAMAMYEFVKV